MSETDFERYMTMREIGKHYGVSSHVVGKWLTRLGLRENGQPTKRALEGRFCKKVPDRDRGIYFFVWQAERTLAALEELIEECMERKGAANGKQ